MEFADTGKLQDRSKLQMQLEKDSWPTEIWDRMSGASPGLVAFAKGVSRVPFRCNNHLDVTANTGMCDGECDKRDVPSLI